MAQISAAWDPGDYVTAQAAAAIVGGRAVVPASGVTLATGGRVPVTNASAGGVEMFGVAAFDAASGDDVNIIRSRTILCRIEAGATVTAGNPVKLDTVGRVIPQGGTGAIVGRALEDAASGGRVLVDRQFTT